MDIWSILVTLFGVVVPLYLVYLIIRWISRH